MVIANVPAVNWLETPLCCLSFLFSSTSLERSLSSLAHFPLIFIKMRMRPKRLTKPDNTFLLNIKCEKQHSCKCAVLASKFSKSCKAFGHFCGHFCNKLLSVFTIKVIVKLLYTKLRGLSQMCSTIQRPKV